MKVMGFMIRKKISCLKDYRVWLIMFLLSLSIGIVYSSTEKIFPPVIRQINSEIIKSDDRDNLFSASYTISDDAGPTELDLLVPKNEDSIFLEEVINKIFPNGHRSELDEEKAIAIMRYVSSSLKLKSNSGTTTKILTEGYGICGAMSQAFRTLCRTVGLPSRYIGAFNLWPVMGSHAISEVYYNGKWHLMDPTFGIFFYSRPTYDGKGEIASFHDLTSSLHGHWMAMKVVPEPWTGIYDETVRAFLPVPAEPDYLKRFYGVPILDLYKKYIAETLPISYGGGGTVSFPVVCDLRTSNMFNVGQVDGNFHDVVRASLKSGIYSGIHYVGTSTPPCFHTWLLTGCQKQMVRVAYSSISKSPKPLRLLPLKDTRLVAHKRADSTETFELLVIGDEAIFSVYCPGGTFLVDAIQASRLD